MVFLCLFLLYPFVISLIAILSIFKTMTNPVIFQLFNWFIFFGIVVAIAVVASADANVAIVVDVVVAAVVASSVDANLFLSMVMLLLLLL
jgi:hypothetical protein